MSDTHPLVQEAQSYDKSANVHITCGVERLPVNIDDRRKAFEARKEARQQ